MEFKVTMNQERLTKGTVLFTAQSPEDAIKIPSIYIKKEAFTQTNGGQFPQQITITVEG